MAKEAKETQSTTDKEMQILLAGATVTVAGKELHIKPYSWADTFRLAKPLGFVLHAFSSHIDGLQEALNVPKDASVAELAGRMGTFLASFDDADSIADALATLAVKASGLSRAEVDALPMDEFFYLAKAIFEANRDFFSKKLAPLMTQAKDKKQPLQKS